MDNETLNLTVQVKAEEWAYHQRRATYLETMLLRVTGIASEKSEWFSVVELVEMRLPGLPPSKAGMTRKASKDGWRKRPMRGIKGGAFNVFHISSLPARAFDALIARMLDLPPMELEAELLPPAPPEPAPPTPNNTAPAWVLPLMRLMKGEAHGDLGRAWQALPAHLPRGTALPDVQVAAKVLVELGLVKG